MIVRTGCSFLGALTLVLISGPLTGVAQNSQTGGADETASARCTALASESFATLQDAPTQIKSTKVVAAGPDGPAYCDAEGYVSTTIGFSMRLPLESWNGKFIELGCGGACGNTAFWLWWCPLHRGYACIASDMGHVGKGQDGLWAYNNLQGQVDFAYRGPHVVSIAGKAITERYYSQPPKYSYFHGCSTGGRQALVEAERFPWDFNGIIGGGPWIDDSDSAMYYVWASRALRGPDGKLVLTRHDLLLVHEAALAACDVDDGVRDGVIGDPLHCHFDPGVLACRSSQQKNCLTTAQVDAVRKVYTGPVNSKGEKLFIGGSVPGSEMRWVGDATTTGATYVREDGKQSEEEEWAVEFFRYMVLPPAGPTWKLTDYDFDRDYKRFPAGTQEALLSADNPELRKFKAAGGKLLVYQGWSDESIVPARTIDFYNTVARTMGSRAATEGFFRLFMVPGMGHCTGEDGPFAVDYLTYMEQWVEQGKAPDVMVGAHVEGLTRAQDFMLKFPLDKSIRVTYTRPLYPYPLRYKYKGNGDPTDAGNFIAVGSP